MSFLKPNQRIDDYTLLEYINSGGTAEVWKVKKDNGEIWAMKVFAVNVGLDSASIRDISDAYNKVKHLDHENILVPVDCQDFHNRPYLVLPLCTGGSLSDIFKQRLTQNRMKKPAFSEKEMGKILLDIASGLAYLHSDGIDKAHLDIKPGNVLLNKEENRYIIADFDISVDLKRTIMKKTQPQTANLGFTPDYAAPEQFDFHYQGNFASDIFALGVSMYEMSEGKLPFGANTMGGMLNSNKKIPELEGDYSVEFKNLIMRCLSKKTTDRPTALELQSWASYFMQNDVWPVELKKLNSNKLLKPILFSALGLVMLLISGFSIYNMLGSDTRPQLHPKVATAMHQMKVGKINKAKEILMAAQGESEDPKIDKQLEIVNKILDQKYKKIRPYKHNRAAVMNAEKKWGFINDKGEELIPCIYTGVTNFHQNNAGVNKETACGFIDKEGKEFLMQANCNKSVDLLSESLGRIGQDCFDLNQKKKIDCQ